MRPASIIKHVIHKVVEGDLDMNARRKKWFPILVVLLLAGSWPDAPGASRSRKRHSDQPNPKLKTSTKTNTIRKLRLRRCGASIQRAIQEWGNDREQRGYEVGQGEVRHQHQIAVVHYGYQRRFCNQARLAMSSGQEMPDIVTLGTENQLAQDLIDSGMFAEVGTLFDQYASETWKNAMNLDSNVWNQYSRDGKRMGLPVLDFAYNHDYVLWIRQDWLDKLGMSAPKTMDELEQVMEAFKNQNPSGLAPDKVTPLSIGFKTSMSTWMGDPSWIFGAYGTPREWNVAEDGSLEYGSVHPGMKEGLAKLNEWMNKGYIPKEAALWDENKTAEPAVAGTAGIIPGPYWMSGWPLIDTVKNAPEAVWKPVQIPAGPDGTAMRHGTQYTNGVTLIHKDMEHPEALHVSELPV